MRGEIGVGGDGAGRATLISLYPVIGVGFSGTRRSTCTWVASTYLPRVQRGIVGLAGYLLVFASAYG